MSHYPDTLIKKKKMIKNAFTIPQGQLWIPKITVSGNI